MSQVLLSMSVSLDGFMRAPNPTPEEPLGVGGEQLHEWAFGADPEGAAILEKMIEGIGASVCGRGMYDDSLLFWGADGPTGKRRLPLFVVTHKAPKSSPEGGVYHFVTDGLEAAIAAAEKAAGGKRVSLAGGADLAQQAIRQRLVDEITVVTVPVLFGSGLRLFDKLGDDAIQLEQVRVQPTKTVTVATYRIVN